MTNETLIVLCWELYEHRMAKNQIAQRLGKHRETIHLWIRGIQELWFLGFLDKNRRAKKGEPKRRQVDPLSSGMFGKSETENMTIMGRKYNTFWSGKGKCISPSANSMRFRPKNILSPSYRKTNKENKYQRLFNHYKQSK